MAGFSGSGTKGGNQGRNVAYGVPTRKVRTNKHAATNTAVNSGRKGGNTYGGTGGRKA